MLEKIVHAGTICSSFLLASATLSKLADLPIPEKQVERLTRGIGTERVAERDANVATYEAMRVVAKFETPGLMAAPDLAVVMVDGGRLQVLDSEATTKPIPKQEEASVEEISVVDLPLDEAEPPAKNRHWREDRIGLLLTMSSSMAPSDPSPQIPDVFLDAERMHKLARELTHQAKMMASEELSVVEETAESAPEEAKYASPSVLSSRVVATRNSWEDFTPMLAEAAWAWGFQKALRRAFVADGAKCNWTLQKRCFAQFVPILDFIHALSYVYAAAHAGRTEEKGWAFSKYPMVCGGRWKKSHGLTTHSTGSEKQTVQPSSRSPKTLHYFKTIRQIIHIYPNTSITTPVINHNARRPKISRARPPTLHWQIPPTHI